MKYGIFAQFRFKPRYKLAITSEESQNPKPEDSLCCERSVQQQTTDIYFSELTPLIVFVTFYRKYRPSASKWRWLRLFSYSNHKTRTFEFQSTIESNRLFFTLWITLKQLVWYCITVIQLINEFVKFILRGWTQKSPRSQHVNQSLLSAIWIVQSLPYRIIQIISYCIMYLKIIFQSTTCFLHIGWCGKGKFSRDHGNHICKSISLLYVKQINKENIYQSLNIFDRNPLHILA